MTPPHAQSASVGRPRADVAARAEPAGPYVVNLCSSTTPMALSQPQDPELKRFAFFVSRRLEDGRERFRLHMGYFETLPEAEEWVAVVREFYPGAWAGEAPGKRLRAREQPAAASAATRQDPPPVRAIPVLQPAPEAVAPAVAAPEAAATAPVAAVSAVPVGAVPVAAAPMAAAPAPSAPVSVAAAAIAPAAAASVAAAPTRAAVASAAPGAFSPVPPAAVRPAAPPAPAPAPITLDRLPEPPRTPMAQEQASPPVAASAPKAASAPAASSRTSARPAAPPSEASRPAAARAETRAPTASKPAGGQSGAAATLRLSNVREVLASLDETDATREMPAASASRPQEPRPQESESGLTDTQVLTLLESRRADGKRAEPDSSISLLRPDDTGTRRALKEAVAANVPVSFAVQLQWSVQPIDVAKVPPLAIFGAYTLYTVEGSREGRRWYGLRLGFFSDAISAKQVAHYVRSEFNSVAVVPVSPQERGRACDSGGGAGASSGASPSASSSASQSASPSAGSSGSSSATPSPSKASKPSGARSPVRDRLPEPTSEFKLFDDEPPVPRAPAPAPKSPSAKPRAAARAVKRAAKGASRVRAREKRSPQTLEETLEILGADELEIDDKRGAGTSASPNGVRPLRTPERRNSPFTKLLDRLAERSRRDR